MGGFAQIYRGFCKLGGDTDTGLKAPNGVNFNGRDLRSLERLLISFKLQRSKF